MKPFAMFVALVVSGSALYFSLPDEPTGNFIPDSVMQYEAVSMDCASLTKYDEYQKHIIRRSMELGSDEGLGYTLAAIAIQESQAGKFVVNAKTHAYGPYHILLKTAVTREGASMGTFQANMIASKLVTDIEYSAKHAMTEIKYWKKVHKGDMHKVLMSYNGGWKAANKSESRHYAEVVSQKARELKTCSV